MEEKTTGIYRVLASPWVYDFFQRLVGAYAWRDRVLRRFVSAAIPKNGKIIDIGCGTAEALRALPDGVEYIGLDKNSAYIHRARECWGHLNAVFYHGEVLPDFLINERPADAVLALGLIHHLNDVQALDLFRWARKMLGREGFLIIIEPVLDPQQSALARYVLFKDRGTAVRTELAYKELAHKAFSRVDVFIEKNPLRIPYTGIVMRCAD